MAHRRAQSGARRLVFGLDVLGLPLFATRSPPCRSILPADIDMIAGSRKFVTQNETDF